MARLSTKMLIVYEFLSHICLGSILSLNGVSCILLLLYPAFFLVNKDDDVKIP